MRKLLFNYSSIHILKLEISGRDTCFHTIFCAPTKGELSLYHASLMSL
jgi:hypothetical protein